MLCPDLLLSEYGYLVIENHPIDSGFSVICSGGFLSKDINLFDDLRVFASERSCGINLPGYWKWSGYKFVSDEEPVGKWLEMTDNGVENYISNSLSVSETLKLVVRCGDLILVNRDDDGLDVLFEVESGTSIPSILGLSERESAIMRYLYCDIGFLDIDMWRESLFKEELINFENGIFSVDLTNSFVDGRPVVGSNIGLEWQSKSRVLSELGRSDLEVYERVLDILT